VALFTYSEIENALAQMVQISKVDRPAFTARLRHLRNLGLPQTKPGSGKRVSYTEADAEEMLIALLLERLGCSPRTAIRSAQIARRGGRRAGILAILADGRIVTTEADGVQDVIRHEAAVLVVNLSLAVAQLDDALSGNCDHR
jgi:hypothetical protein